MCPRLYELPMKLGPNPPKWALKGPHPPKMANFEHFLGYNFWYISPRDMILVSF